MGKRALHVLDMGGSALNTRSAVGRAFFTMAAAFAEMERNLTSERTRMGMAHLRKNGLVYTAIPPLGWDGTGKGTEGAKLTPNKAEQAVVKKIVRLRQAG
jgi:DNA invertase Pin-like site-specific DNA recombinase